jgi:hypothetical protein
MITPSNTLAPGLVSPPEGGVENLLTAWRDACTDLRVAYEAWRENGPAKRADAFAAYVAAADREAAAGEAVARGGLAPAMS